MWLGEIDEVIATLGYPLKEMEGESFAGAVNPPGEDFRVTGTKGEIIIEKGRGGRSLLYGPEHRDGLDILEEDQTRDSAIGLELADFAAAVLEGTELTAGPEVSLGELRTALAMYRSAESRQWEKVW